MNDRDKYLAAYLKNEYNANKVISISLIGMAVSMLAFWIGFLTNFFKSTRTTFIIICVALPLLTIILLTPLLFIKSHYIEKPGYKYFLLTCYIASIAVINIVLPKHGVLGWAICIILANHYYNPKVGRTIFAISIVSMLLCIYFGLFVGEFDPYLLMGEVDEATETIHSYLDTTKVFSDTPAGRYEYLLFLKEHGYNRFISIFLNYYINRAILITILFIIADRLNKRTYKLFLEGFKVTSQIEKVGTELNVAKEIQMSSLPPASFQNEDLEIVAELKATKEVGGDFYYYDILDDEHAAILVGDVSGKGVPAAMFMMKTMTCFKNFIAPNKKPSEILDRVNKNIYKDNTNQMFVTCFLAIINTKNGEVTFANAGHNPPIYGSNHNYKYLECNHGFILGAMEKCLAKDETIKLNKGDRILLYTDGITESRNEKGEFFGEKRFIELMNKFDFSTQIEIHKNLRDTILEFVGNSEQADDITVLSLEYQGKKYTLEEKIFGSSVENAAKVDSFIENFLDRQEINKSKIASIKLVSDELISNIVKYAYPNEKGDIYIRLLLSEDKKEFVMTIIDTGVPFNPFEEQEKPIEGNAMDAEEGGLGILIIKQVMNKCFYDRIYNKNIVTLKKSL